MFWKTLRYVFFSPRKIRFEKFLAIIPSPPVDTLSNQLWNWILHPARIYMEHLAEFRPLEVDREITRTVMDLLRRWRAKLLDYTRLCGLREVYLCTLPATVYFEQREIPRQFVERQTLRIFADMNFPAFRTWLTRYSSHSFFAGFVCKNLYRINTRN